MTFSGTSLARCVKVKLIWRLGRPCRWHAIAHGNDGIERVECSFVSLHLSFYGSMLSGYFHFGNNHILLQLTFVKNMNCISLFISYIASILMFTFRKSAICIM